MGRRTTIGEAALAVLAQHGPLELEELARLVAEHGVTRAKRPAVSVRQAIAREPREEPIPALGGLTPRQAVADSARRPAVEALLDDFDWMEAQAGPDDRGRGMDPARLRELLGLPGRR